MYLQRHDIGLVENAPQLVDFAREAGPQLGLRELDIFGELPLDARHLLRTHEGREEPHDHHEVP